MELGSQKYLKTACRLTKSSQAISRGSTRGQITCNSIWKTVWPIMKKWQMSRLTQLRLSVSTISDKQLSSPTLTRDLDLTVLMATYSPRMRYLERKSCKRLLTHSTVLRYLSTCELVDQFHYRKPSQKVPALQMRSDPSLSGLTCLRLWRKRFSRE